MTTIDRFVSRCADYRRARCISETYLSRLLFDDGKVIGSLRDGADITVRRLSRADIVLGELERALANSTPGRTSHLTAD